MNARISESRFLDPAALHAVGDLALVARIVVDGLLAGLHPGSRPAEGVEFGGYRPYQRGDDLHRVDWRLWARSDRYWLRLAEVEREIRLRLLLDATASMAHRDGNGLAKFDYARLLAASLVQLARQQGDRFALQLVADDRLVEVESGPPRSALSLLVHALETAAPGGGWPTAGALSEHLSRTQEREILVLISDLHEVGSEIRRTLARLASLGHEVIVFRLLARNELELSLDGPATFEDLETGARLATDPEAFRERYLRALDRQRDELRRELSAAGVDLHEVALDEGLDLVLRRFLLRRREVR